MGVPRFFSWITRRYPLSMQNLDDNPIPEIDCLYLDMNGIIYKCSKDDSIIFRDQVMSRKAEQIWFSIFNYVNSIVDMIKPRKLLFLGLDGVAPRAKMNNQRSRRFKSAKDYKELEKKLEYLGDAKNEEEFQNNCITPGTEFMSELNRQLRFFVAKKIEEDVKWRGFNVLFSGADVPGEGEHKIMDFIRKSSNLGVYDEQTTHCLYGADADLIMLGMSLKVKKLCIIREQFVAKPTKTIISQTRSMKQINFKIIYVNILRQYFDLEYNTLKNQMKIPYEAQRVINDFVFLCFFIGNDFLPRCYCYDIREGNLQMLIYGFKKFLKQCESYLIDEETINLVELERLTKILSEFQGQFIGSRSEESELAYKAIVEDKQTGEVKNELAEFEQQFADKIANTLEKIKTQQEFLLKLKTLYQNDKLAAKATYYEAKLKFNPATEPAKLNELINHYIQGLHYVSKYYFGGLPSWQWYFPHYYAPLVADLASYLSFMNQNSIGLTPFNKSQPYEPFKQLMCILPRDSAVLLPKCLQPLIQDESSQLRRPFDYFPDKIQIDPYGGLREHEFVNILPFIDQSKMTEVYNSVPLESYSAAELQRNKFSLNELYKYSPTGKVHIKTNYTQISDFDAPITIQLIDFSKNDVLKLKDQTKPGVKSINQAGQYTFPTLYMQKFQSTFVYLSKRQRRIELIIPNTSDKEELKLGAEVYHGYPFESYGRVAGIATSQDIKTIKQFDITEFIKDSDLTQKDLQEYQKCWSQSVKRARKKGLQINTQKVYYVKQPLVTVRKFNGDYARSFCITLDSVEPSSIVSTIPRYSFTHTVFKPKNIRQEFLEGETVAVLATKWAGSRGVVVGYSQDNGAVKVKITDPISDIPKQILKAINTNEYFFEVKFVAQLMQVDVRILLDILDSIQVILDPNQPISLAFSKNLDLGLNLIKKNEKKIVPNMVRFKDQGAQTDNLFKLFYSAEISLGAVNLLHEYKKEHPYIFTFMQHRLTQLQLKARQGYRMNFNEPIHAKDIFPSDKDPNKPVTKTYLWLLKQQQIYYHNASLNSKKVSKQKVAKLLQYFRRPKQQLLPKNDFYFDPNYLYTQRLTEKGVYYLSTKPQYHAIQDRVICLNEAFFGERAVIIGISDFDYEVLFERASFGKNDLGGLVDFLWGGKFDFRELFNISTCGELILPRFKSNSNTNSRRFWDGSRPEFISRYHGKAISNLREFEQANRHMNCPFVVGYKLAKQATGVPDDGFQIVAPKRTLKSYYPNESQRKAIDETHHTKDPMKIVKDFAKQKNAMVDNALDGPNSEDERPPRNFNDFEQANEQGHGGKQGTVFTQFVPPKQAEEKKPSDKRPEQPKKKEFVKFIPTEQPKKNIQKGKPEEKSGAPRDKPKPKYVAKEEKTQAIEKKQPKIEELKTEVKVQNKEQLKPEENKKQVISSQTVKQQAPHYKQEIKLQPINETPKVEQKIEQKPQLKPQHVNTEDIIPPTSQPKQPEQVKQASPSEEKKQQQGTNKQEQLPKEEFDDEIFG